MSARVRVVPRTAAELRALSNPNGASSESIPDIKYDTQSYTSTGLASLTFFQTANTDKTLSNMEQGGAFPAPQFFEIHYLLMDFLAPGPSNVTVPASGTNATGILNDIDLILKAQRATVTLSVSNKIYGPWPATFLHASGGGVGMAFATGGATTLGEQFGQNGIMDGGWYIGGAIIIPPSVGFSITLNLAAAQAISVTTNIRISMAGVLHRKVL